VKTKSLAFAFGLAAAGLCATLARSTAQNAADRQAEALELLRRTLAEQQANPGRIVRTEEKPAAAKPLVLSPAAAARRSDLERQYLDGKLTARQYQKAIDRLEEDETKRIAAEAARPRPTTPSPTPKVATSSTNLHAPAKPVVQRATSPKNTTTAIVTPPDGTVSPPPTPSEPTPQQQKIADVEARIDEMLRLKAQREKAALTNVVTVNTNLPATPQTRRQRLDAILKQNLDGTLSDADYQAQRAKILAETE
jgi:hypothetical protein